MCLFFRGLLLETVYRFLILVYLSCYDSFPYVSILYVYFSVHVMGITCYTTDTLVIYLIIHGVVCMFVLSYNG